MKPEIAEKWVKALRSKKYRQGKYVLKKKTQAGTVQYCCLGVLCELYDAQKKQGQKGAGLVVRRATQKQISGLRYYINKNSTVYSFNGKNKTEAITELPYHVQKWAGMRSSSGQLPDKPGGNLLFSKPSLANLNDKGRTFEQIATVIEKNFEDL